MLQIVNQAVMLGFTASQILKFVASKFPNFKSGIDKARTSGFDDEKILKFLSQKIPSNPEDVDQQLSANDQYLKSQGYKTKKEREASRNQALKGALGVGSAALSTYALSRALPKNASALVSQISGAPGQQTSSEQPQLTESAQRNIELPTASQQPPVNQVTPNIAQQVQPIQAQGIVNPKDFLEKMGVLEQVDEHLKRGNTPEVIAAYLTSSGYKGRKEPTLKSGDLELLRNIEEYAKTSQLTNEMLPESNELVVPNLGEMGSAITGNLYSGLFDALKAGKTKFAGIEDPLLKKAKAAFEAGEIKSPEDLQKFANKPKEEGLSKGATVASPQGVGEIKEIRNGKAIIDVDGKKHQVEEKSLLKPPKEAAIEAMELIKSFTPEAMRSTHHMLNSYDEEEKKGFFVFHNGSAYVVDDISPEEYKELSEEIEHAKTTGETIIGKWAAGEGSRGAGYNKVVKGVRNRKVVPELKKKYRKLKVGYNLLAEWQRLLNEKE